jgi:hypothetical protein
MLNICSDVAWVVRDDYDDVVDDCASVATDSTMGYEKDDDGEFGA